MRSSVLLLYCQISWRATDSSQYFWGLFIRPTFKTSFQEALPPMVGLIFFCAGSTLASTNGPTSAAICSSCWIGDDVDDFPTSFSFSASCLLLSNSPGEGGASGTSASPCACYLIFTCCPLIHPPLGMIFILATLEWKSNQSEVLAGFS